MLKKKGVVDNKREQADRPKLASIRTIALGRHDPEPYRYRSLCPWIVNLTRPRSTILQAGWYGGPETVTYFNRMVSMESGNLFQFWLIISQQSARTA